MTTRRPAVNTASCAKYRPFRAAGAADADATRLMCFTHSAAATLYISVGLLYFPCLEVPTSCKFHPR